MIGNDIVDLALAKKESNWQRKCFLDKLFSKEEQSCILNSETPDTTVWNLWSRKEAAYKIYNRQTGIRVFNPLSFNCLDVNLTIGKVVSNQTIYFVKTEITKDYIHSIAVTDLRDFEQLIFIDSADVSKINGIPFYNLKNENLKPASKSHHGSYERIISLV